MVEWVTQKRSGAPSQVNIGPTVIETMLSPTPLSWLAPIYGLIQTIDIDTQALCSVEAPEAESWGFADVLAAANPDTRQQVTDKLIRVAKNRVWPTYCEYVPQSGETPPDPPHWPDAPANPPPSGYDNYEDQQLVVAMARQWSFANISPGITGTGYFYMMANWLLGVMGQLSEVEQKMIADKVTLDTIAVDVSGTWQAQIASLIDQFQGWPMIYGSLQQLYDMENAAVVSRAAILAALTGAHGFPDQYVVDSFNGPATKDIPAGVIGVILSTEEPLLLGRVGAEPPAYMELGWLTVGADGAFFETIRWKHNPQIIFPFPARASTLSVDQAADRQAFVRWIHTTEP